MKKFNNTFIIGDIHGGFKALLQVLEKSGFDYENDRLISLGDLADGWSETHLVIEELMKMKNLILLRGNHDEWALQALSTAFLEDIQMEDREAFKIAEKYYTASFFSMSGMGRAWYVHGGKGTEASYKARPDLICSHIKFLDAAHIYYIDVENRFFSHAGPSPHCGLAETPDAEFYWNRDFWQQTYSGQNPGREWEEVYIGHSPTLNHPSNKEDCTKPINRYNVWNMDTGACFHGKLSMMNIYTKELFQSDPVRELYPDEYGRSSRTFNQLNP